MKNSINFELTKTASHFLVIFALLMFAGIFLYFLCIVFFSFTPLFSSNEQFSVGSASFLVKTILFTIAQALCSVFISCLLGIPLGFYIAKRKFFLSKFLESLSGIPLALPSLLIILGYIETFGINGLYNNLIQQVTGNKDFSIHFLYSFTGIILCQGFYNFPLVMISVARTWEKIPPNQAQIAKILGASNWKIFKDITIHQIMGGILAGAIPVFIFCFFSFMIILVFGKIGTTTLEVLLYNQAKNTLNLKNAAFFAMLETFFAIIIISLYGKFEQKAKKTNSVDLSIKNRKERLLKKEKIILSLLLLTIFVFFIIPIISVIFSSFYQQTYHHFSLTISLWKKTLQSLQFLFALKNSLAVALVTASLSVCIATTFSILVKINKTKIQNVLRIIPYIPMVISSVVLGFGITQLKLTNTMFTLCIAQTMIMWPFAFRQIFSCIEKIPENIIYSEQLLSKTKTFGFFSIFIPYGKANIKEAWGLIFAMSLGDASLPLILSIPRFTNLSLSTYNLIASYRFGEASVFGVIIAIIAILVLYVTKEKDKKNVF